MPQKTVFGLHFHDSWKKIHKKCIIVRYVRKFCAIVRLRNSAKYFVSFLLFSFHVSPIHRSGHSVIFWVTDSTPNIHMVREVYCPKCKSLVGHIFFDRQKTLETRCRNCRIKIKYDVASGRSRYEPIPPRTTSSGVRI